MFDTAFMFLLVKLPLCIFAEGENVGESPDNVRGNNYPSDGVLGT